MRIYHGDLRQTGHVDPGEGLQLSALLQLLQNLLESALELGLVPPDQTFLLLPLLPLLRVLLRELHPEGVQVLSHLGRVTAGSTSERPHSCYTCGLSGQLIVPTIGFISHDFHLFGHKNSYLQSVNIFTSLSQASMRAMATSLCFSTAAISSCKARSSASCASFLALSISCFSSSSSSCHRCCSSLCSSVRAVSFLSFSSSSLASLRGGGTARKRVSSHV